MDGCNWMKIGTDYERWIVEEARRRGMPASVCSGQYPHDAVICGLRVQCKTKSHCKRDGVEIRNSRGSYRVGDWDVLALRYDGDDYLIPAEVLANHKTGTLRNRLWPYRFAGFIDAWHVFDSSDQEHPVIEKQMQMFG